MKVALNLVVNQLSSMVRDLLVLRTVMRESSNKKS